MERSGLRAYEMRQGRAGTTVIERLKPMTLLAGYGKTISAERNFDGRQVWDKPSLPG
jgi:hypothetical protein